MINLIFGRTSTHEVKEKESFYLLVVKEFKISEAQIDLKMINDGQIDSRGEIKKTDDKMISLRGDIQTQIGVMESKISYKIGSLNKGLNEKIGTLKNDLDKKIGILKGSLETQIEHTNQMVSEILTALGKKEKNKKRYKRLNNHKINFVNGGKYSSKLHKLKLDELSDLLLSNYRWVIAPLFMIE